MEHATITLTQQVAAAPEAVWAVITEKYPQWISAVCGDGARVAGEWAAGAELEFFAPGGKGGVAARVTDFSPPRLVRWETIAPIADGARAEFSAQNEMMRGMSEQYALAAEAGGTLITATLQTPPPMRDFTAQKWPAALEKIRVLAENS